MTVAIRYKANLAEEHPEGNLVGVEAITELEQRIEELYEEGTELFDAAEAESPQVAAVFPGGRRWVKKPSPKR